MSHFIVLVKQVPDVSQIDDNAFDPESGNLMRGKLPSVINELDTEALALAAKMRKLQGEQGGQILAVTMGPPMAKEVLTYCLARGADDAVLLTDKALGGADTWATAYPLACTIQKLIQERFGDDSDYYIVTGMQSVDGDTAQVPAQIAEALKIPCLAYATDVAWQQDAFAFTRIITGGSQVAQLKQAPAVVTVAKYDETLFATFAGARLAARHQITKWDAREISADAIGVKGSKTRVIKVFPPDRTVRKCQKVNHVEEFAALLVDSYKTDNDTVRTEVASRQYLYPHERSSLFDRRYEGLGKERNWYQWLNETLQRREIKQVSAIDDVLKDDLMREALDAGQNISKSVLNDLLGGYAYQQGSYQGQVWVVAEVNDNRLHPATYELLGKARELADGLQTPVGVVIAAADTDGYASSLIAAGADLVIESHHEKLATQDPWALRKTIAAVIERHAPQIVLFAATPLGRVIAPMISYRLDCGLTADCTSFDIMDNSRKGEIAILMQTRPALGGNVMATICTKNSSIQMATARPGVFKRLPDDSSRQGQVIQESVDLTDDDLSLTILSSDKAQGTVNFDAEVIVSGGKGLQSKSAYDSLLNDLVDAMNRRLDTPVEKGASRAAVEQGFAERIYQVGQTGTAVGPKLYLALGISGAIQHMIGVSNAETIFAINHDHHAPIFEQCDYYMVGSVEELIPELIDKLGAR